MIENKDDGDDNNNSKVDTGLVSYTCQFCNALFDRGTDLALHYKARHLDRMGSS